MHSFDTLLMGLFRLEYYTQCRASPSLITLLVRMTLIYDDMHERIYSGGKHTGTESNFIVHLHLVVRPEYLFGATLNTGVIYLTGLVSISSGFDIHVIGSVGSVPFQTLPNGQFV